MLCKNIYSYPIPKKFIKTISKKSPAHIGKLKNSVDFIIPEGTPIKAAFYGIVVDIKQDSGMGGYTKKFDKYGNYIEIKHANNEYSIYEHIKKNSSLVKVGDKVKEGQIIGYSGKTGWISNLGPHLHFDIHKYFGKGNDDYRTLEIKFSSSSQ